MDYLTLLDLELESKRAETLPGMAHWAGSGPEGTHCGECHYLADVGRQKNRCGKYSGMMQGEVGPKAIPIQMRSCKYFEPKK